MSLVSPSQASPLHASGQNPTELSLQNTVLAPDSEGEDEGLNIHPPHVHPTITPTTIEHVSGLSEWTTIPTELSSESSEDESSQDELDGLTSPLRAKTIGTSDSQQIPTPSMPHKLETKVVEPELEAAKWISKPKSSSHPRSDSGALYTPAIDTRQSPTSGSGTLRMKSMSRALSTSSGSGSGQPPSSVKYRRSESPGSVNVQDPCSDDLTGIMEGSDAVSITYAKPRQKPLFDGIEILTHRPKIHANTSSKVYTSVSMSQTKDAVLGRVENDLPPSVREGEYASPPLNFPSSSHGRDLTPPARVVTSSVSNSVSNSVSAAVNSSSIPSLDSSPIRSKFIGVVIPLRSEPTLKAKAASSRDDAIATTMDMQSNQSSLLSALSNTFRKNTYSSTSFPITSRPAPQDARHLSYRNAKPRITSSTFTGFNQATSLRPNAQKENLKDNHKVFLTEATVNALLDTKVAPMTIGMPPSVVGAFSSEMSMQQVGHESEMGWGGMLLSNESERDERRERRVNMNVRFLGSKPAVDFDGTKVIASPSIFSEGMARVGGEGEGGYITTRPQETPNSMFVDRLEGMFGSGNVGRGSVAKPKTKHRRIQPHPSVIGSSDNHLPPLSVATTSSNTSSRSGSPISISAFVLDKVSTGPSSVGWDDDEMMKERGKKRVIPTKIFPT
ncbi:hypothetical protein PILCRDRAFT_819023 [Piloderma croceum F 1598]|uniref:Uncharacterized protein n=1 Tax=Piloderma croceum (strain F 1598) TaxID=765440 RepID=A0A0C3C353_PILCF|nr:hypothetical protein PILCRDRAFT_819023 [Piloderma croceum F 1598]